MTDIKNGLHTNPNYDQINFAMEDYLLNSTTRPTLFLLVRAFYHALTIMEAKLISLNKKQIPVKKAINCQRWPQFSDACPHCVLMTGMI